MPLITLAETRKEKRKAERKKKKRKHHHHDHDGQNEGEKNDPTNSNRKLQGDNNNNNVPIRKKSRKMKEQKVEKCSNNSNEKVVSSSKLLAQKSSSTKNKKQKKEKHASDIKQTNSVNDGDDDTLAAAIRRDEEEIAELEIKLGIKKKKKKKKLNKEYAKLEGYGDDFGDFLDDLDDMVRRVRHSSNSGGGEGGHRGGNDDDDDDSDADDVSDDDDVAMLGGDDNISDSDDDEAPMLVPLQQKKKNTPKCSINMNPDVEAALQRDDEEIKELEHKLGMKNKKDKTKLHKEYSVEGYGDDFGDFLDGLDDIMHRLASDSGNNDMAYYEKMMMKMGKNDNESGNEVDDDESSEEDEEIVPMKEPFETLDEDDSVLDEIEEDEAKEDDDTNPNERKLKKEREADLNNRVDSDEDKVSASDSSDTNSQSGSDSDSESAESAQPDHDEADTYRPSQGEDIYGNRLGDGESGEPKPGKYVPPHLRKKSSLQNGNDDDDADADNQEQLRQIQRLLNNALNRLSDDTLISVAQQVVQIYSSHPTQMVNDMIWKNSMHACVATPMLMTGLIPVYVACLVGAHIQTGDTVQIGEYILEQVISEMWNRLNEIRKQNETNQNEDEDDDDVNGELANKVACNLTVILCYLYNFNIVHCSFMYDIIRHLINEFTEVDIECLLLLLSHSGQSLRADDPLALKEIVLMVQKKKSEGSIDNSSRAEYMVSAIMDLKNNKRRKQDCPYSERSSKLKKMIGRIKSVASKNGNSKTSSEQSLRISLQDILDAEKKGRWWKVGASWIGNQYRFDESDGVAARGDNDGGESNLESKESKTANDGEDEKLLKLASKLRMNTDRKRAIFCIIMGGNDCEDCFEKLCRSLMLQNRSERDTVRVLMECCGNEKSYNKFYGHLASRICEYQPQSKFSIQLAFWDIFKQFDTMTARKAANLAKLLFNLVVVHQVLKLLPVLRGMNDISEGDMPNSQTIFLTILMSSILDYADEPAHAKSLFSVSDPSKEEQNEGVRAGLLVFFLETLKASPKNTKGSKFRKNFKSIVKELDTDGFESMF